MEITLKQVEKDIQDGKSTMIFYSTKSVWWTHLSEDLEEARKMGQDAQRKQIQKTLDDPHADGVQKRFLKRHLDRMDDPNAHQTPLDPSGAPLLQTENAMDFIEQAIAQSDHYGPHGLDAFMKAHHQNCNGWAPPNWGAITAYLDRKKMMDDARKEEE